MYVGNPSGSFTRPNNTNAYSSGNLVANSTAAGSVVPVQIQLVGSSGVGSFRVTRARLFKSSTTSSNANFRIHIYQSSPTVANGDGSAWSTNKAADWLGNIDVTSMLAFTDGCCGTGSAAAGSEMFLKLASGTSVYVLLEAKAAYAPAANEVFTITLEEVDDF